MPKVTVVYSIQSGPAPVIAKFDLQLACTKDAFIMNHSYNADITHCTLFIASIKCSPYILHDDNCISTCIIFKV